MVEWAILSGLPQADRSSVLAATHRKRYRRGETVFHEGEPGDTLHLLAKGKVVVKATTPGGDTASVTVLNEGSYFGELALVSDDNTRKATVVALEAVETRALHRSSFLELRRQHPDVQDLLAAILADQVQSTTALLLEALYLPAEKRVLRRLVDLARIYGASDGRTEIHLTQEDLASLAGTTRSTANRVLRDAEQQGILTIERGRLTLHDVEELARRAR